MARTRPALPPGCLHCGHLFTSRTDARTHTCDPDARDAWQQRLRDTVPAPGMLDLGNGFLLRLPEDAG